MWLKKNHTQQWSQEAKKKQNMEKKKGRENITFSLWKYTKTVQNILLKYQNTYSIQTLKRREVTILIP